MTMQEDEVSELKYISVKELEDKIKKGDEEIPLVKKSLTKLTLNRIKEIIGGEYGERSGKV